MLCFYAGFGSVSRAHTLTIGLTEEEVKAMLQENVPLLVPAKNTGLPTLDNHFVLFAGKDQGELTDRLRRGLDKLAKRDVVLPVPPSEAKLQSVVDHVYLFAYRMQIPSLPQQGHSFFYIGLDFVACQLLGRGVLTVRVKARRGYDVDVLIFRGRTDQSIEANLKKQGLITSDTQCRYFDRPGTSRKSPFGNN